MASSRSRTTSKNRRTAAPRAVPLLGALLGVWAAPAEEFAATSPDEAGGSPPAAGGGSGVAPPPATASAAPATGQRLTDRQYLNVVADVLGVDATTEAGALPLDSKLEGFRNAATALLPSDLRIEGYASLSVAIVGRIDWAQRLARDGGCAELTEKCQRDFLSALGRRLFRRPLGEAQLARLGAIFAAVKKEGDPFAVAAALATRAMLQSPELLYRLESPRVDGFDLATRLSFLLWNSAPDDVLLDAAARGQLATPAGVHAQIGRMLDDPRARRALRDYVDDWLDADKLGRPGAIRSASRSSTPPSPPTCARRCTGCSRGWSGRRTAICSELLRSERTAVSPALARIYGLPAPAGPGFAEQSLAGVPTRIGLLTQAGILTVTSVGGAGSSIVDRGVFAAQHPLPAAARAAEQRARVARRRQRQERSAHRLAQHRKDPACGACHNQIDPLGLAFEAYDAIGAHRDADEQGNALTGAGRLVIEGEELPYGNIREFVGALARHPALEACLVRKVVQYSFARPLEPGDDAFADQLIAGFRKGGRRYRGLLAVTAASPWLRAEGVAK